MKTLFFIFSLMFSMLYQVETFPGPIMNKNMKNTIRRLLHAKEITHLAVSTKLGKYGSVDIKQRQLLTDSFGCPILPKTDTYGNPILVPRTDEYGKPYTDGSTIRIQTSRMRRLAKRCRIQNSLVQTATSNTYPPLVPKTDSYGMPFTERPIKFSTIHQKSSFTVTNTTIFHQRKKSQTRASFDMVAYVYVAIGTVVFLLVTVAVFSLILWVIKKKNQRRVDNADSL